MREREGERGREGGREREREREREGKRGRERFDRAASAESTHPYDGDASSRPNPGRVTFNFQIILKGYGIIVFRVRK